MLPHLSRLPASTLCLRPLSRTVTALVHDCVVFCHLKRGMSIARFPWSLALTRQLVVLKAPEHKKAYCHACDRDWCALSCPRPHCLAPPCVDHPVLPCCVQVDAQAAGIRELAWGNLGGAGRMQASLRCSWLDKPSAAVPMTLLSMPSSLSNWRGCKLQYNQVSCAKMTRLPMARRRAWRDPNACCACLHRAARRWEYAGSLSEAGPTATMTVSTISQRAGTSLCAHKTFTKEVIFSRSTENGSAFP